MAFILTHKNRRWIARALSRFTVKRQAYKIRATVAFTRLLTSSLIRDRRFNGEMRDCCASISIQISEYNASYVLTSALGSIRRFLKHSTNPAVSSPRYLRLNDNISVEFAIRTFDEPNGVCLFQVFVFDSGLWSVKTPNIQYTDTTVYLHYRPTVQQVLQSTQILQVNCCQSLCCLMVKPRTVIAFTDQVEKNNAAEPLISISTSSVHGSTSIGLYWRPIWSHSLAAISNSAVFIIRIAFLVAFLSDSMKWRSRVMSDIIQRVTLNLMDNE